MAKRKEYSERLPRGEVLRVEEALVERFGLDPEVPRCDFRRGTVEVRAEELAILLGVRRVYTEPVEEAFDPADRDEFGLGLGEVDGSGE